ncbi:MAG TPA: hypothetical protein VLL97_12740 [Acidobacteriota bacterium]|nr:hypothetical protein [Acidobacteriota bacterium]
MKALKLMFPKLREIYSATALLLLFSGSAPAQAAAPAPVEPFLAPWTGIWQIADDHVPAADAGREAKRFVEIRPTEDGKGLAVSRNVALQEYVNEIIIPDGVRRPVSSENCSGWQSSRWMPESGVIIGSSEIRCEEAEPYTLSNLRIILDATRMVDILLLQASGQTRVAVQRLDLVRELDGEANVLNSRRLTAARTAISAPWDLNTIIELSGIVDTTALEAALLEKNTQLRLDAKSLRRMSDAQMPDQIIDLIVALSLPDKFIIRENGQVAMRSFTPDASAGHDRYPFPVVYYYPVSLWDYRYIHGFYGYYPMAWNHYSPFWWGYPIYTGRILPRPPSRPTDPSSPPDGEGESRLSSSRGYVQITPRDADRRAVSREAQVQGRTSRTAAPAGRSKPAGQSASGEGRPASSAAPETGGRSPSGGAPSSPGASPAGYRSGESGDGRAAPR